MIIRKATVQDAPKIAEMASELLTEIMDAIGIQAFNFDLPTTARRLIDFLDQEKYFAFIAVNDVSPVGFIALYESYALYAEGAFGTIPEFYVRPPYRSKQLGLELLSPGKIFWPVAQLDTSGSHYATSSSIRQNARLL